MAERQLLDCTLRDGGYINDWNFGHANIIEIFRRLASSGVDYIEIGFLDQRRSFDDYLENASNKDNCLSSEKLKRLGWKCEFSVEDGFKRVFEHQMELKNEKKLCD